jgi:hypothetical protein
VRRIVVVEPELMAVRSARRNRGIFPRAVVSVGGVRGLAADQVSAAAAPDLDGMLHNAVVGGVSLPLTRRRHHFLRQDVAGSRA